MRWPSVAVEHPVVFDFAPQVDTGAELLARRGTDNRLDQLRPAVQRRREQDAEYHARREALLAEQGVSDWRVAKARALAALEDELADDVVKQERQAAIRADFAEAFGEEDE